MKRVWDAIRAMRWEGPRVALALLPLVLMALLYGLVALMAPPAFRAFLLAFAGTYLLAFIALASGWFWARWFASGLGWSGAVMGLAGAILQPDTWELSAFMGGLHAVVVVLLMGKKMAARFDMQPDWRERFGMDDFGVVRLGRAVTRASAALPTLIAMALAPKPEPEWLVLAGAGLGIAGLAGLLRLRTWGVLALGGAGAAVLVASPHVTTLREPILGLPDPMVALTSSGVPGALSLLLFAAALPFAGAAVRYYKSLR